MDKIAFLPLCGRYGMETPLKHTQTLKLHVLSVFVSGVCFQCAIDACFAINLVQKDDLAFLGAKEASGRKLPPPPPLWNLPVYQPLNIVDLQWPQSLLNTICPNPVLPFLGFRFYQGKTSNLPKFSCSDRTHEILGKFKENTDWTQWNS